MSMQCPRCGGYSFRRTEYSPPYIKGRYAVSICTVCKLYYSGLKEKWFADCAHWSEELVANHYKTTPQTFALAPDTMRRWAKGAGPTRDRAIVVRYNPTGTFMPVYVPNDQNLAVAKRAWGTDNYTILGIYNLKTQEKIE